MRNRLINNGTLCMIALLTILFVRAQGPALLVGSGIVSDPYQVTDCTQLQMMRDDLDAHYVLVADIDCAQSADWNTNDCSQFTDRKSCQAESEGCAWVDHSECIGEMFEGCASDEKDCMDWCGGTAWNSVVACEDAYGFSPIGTSYQEPFSGVLDGNGYTIAHLTIHRPQESSVGLIGYALDATIKNISLVGARVTGGGENVGALVGASVSSRIDGCNAADGQVQGVRTVGGLVGTNHGRKGEGGIFASQIQNSIVSGIAVVGAVAGSSVDAEVEEVAVLGGTVNADYEVGGLIGANKRSRVANVVSSTSVRGASTVGGLLGTQSTKGTLENALMRGEVLCEQCTQRNAGAIVGLADDDVQSIFSVYYNQDVGGIQSEREDRARTSIQLQNKETFEGWDFNRVWMMGDDGYPALRILNGRALEWKETAEAEAVSDADQVTENLEQDLLQENTLSTHGMSQNDTKEDRQSQVSIRGQVYRDAGETPAEKNVIVAISVNGGEVLARATTQKEGEFSVESLDLTAGDIVTAFLEGAQQKAVTIFRVGIGEEHTIDIFGGHLTLWQEEGTDSFSNDDLMRAASAGGTAHVDIDAVFMVQDGAITVQNDMTLFLKENSRLDLTESLNAGNVLLEGELALQSSTCTVHGSYRQRSGTLFVQKGNAIFEGDVVLEDGVFDGGEGTVELNFDLIGSMKMQGGTFKAPPVLRIDTDWTQTGGTFEHQNGTVFFAGTSHVLDVPQEETFHNVVVEKQNGTSLIIPDGRTLIVEGMLTLTSGSIDEGTVIVEGMLVHAASFQGGTTLLRIEGVSQREILLSHGGTLPQVVLNAPNVIMRTSEAVANSAFSDGENGVNDERFAVSCTQDIHILNGQFIIDAGAVHCGSDAHLIVDGGSITVNGGSLITEAPVTIHGGALNVVQGDVLFNGAVEITGGTLDIAGGTVALNSAFIIGGGVVTGTAGNLTVNAVLTLDGGSVEMQETVLEINGPLTMRDGNFHGGKANITINGTLEIGGGTFTAPSSLLRIAGDMRRLSGSFRHNEGTIEFFGTSKALDANGIALYTMRVAKNSGERMVITDGSRVLVEGDVILAGGSLEQGTLEVQGDVLVEEGSDGGSVSWLCTGNREQHLSVAGEAVLSGDLTVRKNPDTAVILLTDLRLPLSEQAVVIEKGILDLNGYSVDANSFLVMNGGSLLLRGGEVVSTPELTDGSSVSYILQEAATEVLHTFAYTDLVLNGVPDAEFIVPETGLSVAGDITVRGGTLRVPEEEFIVLGGSWLLQGGEFAAGTGTLSLVGEAQYIEGNNTFHNVQKLVQKDAQGMLIVASGSNQSIDGKLTLQGEQCTFLQVRSSDPQEQWTLQRVRTSSLSTLDVRGVDSFGSRALECTENCIDSGENTNWTFAATGCSAPSTLCGNSKVESSEECDDGNFAENDGCSPFCKLETGFSCKGEPSLCIPGCGDALIVAGEECDDGNATDGDGCSSTCMIEIGYACQEQPSMCTAICGDGVIAGTEECDDGNAEDTDACRSTCTNARCGDDILQSVIGEECDDGNTVSGDGCSQDCTREAFCGDGTLDNGEQCDDGNTEDGDGCSVRCTLQKGYACEGEPSVCELLCGKRVFDLDACHGRFYAAELTGDAQVPPVATPKTGFVIVRVNSDTSLTYSVFAEDVAEGSVAVHNGISGVNGPVLMDLSGFSGTSRILEKPERELLKDGGLYVEVTTADYPEGELRGQLTVVHGSEELPPPVEVCGNGMMEANEECDDGNTSNDDACLNICRRASCGDGHLWEAVEQCEPPFRVVPDPNDSEKLMRCSEQCQLTPFQRGNEKTEQEKKENERVQKILKSMSGSSVEYLCGNGSLDTGEECDLGLLNGIGTCSVMCEILYCGDGLVTEVIGEDCDDGNTTNDDGCTNTCHFAPLPGETENTSSTVVGMDTPAVTVWECGNSILERGEQCDDGNSISGDGCNSACKIELSTPLRLSAGGCGNSILERGEQCDDGNGISGDGCSDICQLEVSILDMVAQRIKLLEAGCGDARLDLTEECDDGNVRDGDGCSSQCRLEITVAGSEQCGDGKLDAGEECDDGGSNSDSIANACRENCTQPHCGDHVLDRHEECDDGNRTDGDGCSATCGVEHLVPAAPEHSVVCGNGLTEPREQCDDGNTTNGDGCSSLCRYETEAQSSSAATQRMVIETIEVSSPRTLRIRFVRPVDLEHILDPLRYDLRGSPVIPVLSVRWIDPYTVELVVESDLDPQHRYTLSVDMVTDDGVDVATQALFSAAEGILEEKSLEHGASPEEGAFPAQESQDVQMREIVTIAPLSTQQYMPVTPVAAETGPGALAAIIAGAAAGFSIFARRKRKYC
ncbi:MAG: DUF4215 domain-containing protein [Candidatus Peribacteraceae bacterium]